MIHLLTYLHSNTNSFDRIIGGIQHCVIVVDKWIFYSNIMFALSLTHHDLAYHSSNNDDIYLKLLGSFQQRKRSVLFRIKETEIMFHVKI